MRFARLWVGCGAKESNIPCPKGLFIRLTWNRVSDLARGEIADFRCLSDIYEISVD